MKRVSSNGADGVVCAYVHLCLSISMHVTVCAPCKCHDTSCARCYQRETHTAGISAGAGDKRERARYRYTTLNTLSHTPWLQPHTGHHRGAHFMDASALRNH